MKLTTTTLLITCFACLHAQITVTNATFPAAGDSLSMSIDDDPSGITIGPSGVDQSWDFTSLNEVISRVSIVHPASEGSAAADFPSADLYVEYENGGEGYYNVTNTVYELVGYKGADPADLGIEVLTEFEPPIVERRAPMNFLDINIYDGALNLPIPTDMLPQEIFDQIGFVTDSIRIRVTAERADVVDAWGELSIPGGTYDVLREKRTEYRNTRFDILIIGAWLDVTDLVGFSEFLGEDTIVTYSYFSNTEKEPIAIATVDTDGSINQVEFKNTDGSVGVEDIFADRPDIRIYPNPAIDEVKFTTTQLPAGNYRLVIYNIIGSKVWERSYYLGGDKSFTENLSLLKKGAYLYSLVNDAGKTICTKRLVIMKP